MTVHTLPQPDPPDLQYECGDCGSAKTSAVSCERWNDKLVVMVLCLDCEQVTEAVVDPGELAYDAAGGNDPS